MVNKVNPPTAVLGRLGLPRELLTVLDQMWIKMGAGVDIISDMEVTQVTEDGGNRAYRQYRDDIYELETRLADLKRNQRKLEQVVFSLQELLERSKATNRLSEQKINELTERLDSGT